jgi:hypothetical protein
VGKSSEALIVASAIPAFVSVFGFFRAVKVDSVGWDIAIERTGRGRRCSFRDASRLSALFIQGEGPI